MDIFAKCYDTTIADEIREKGIYPYFHALESRQAPEVIMENKRRIMLGSNNYLGLTTHPDVIEAGIRAYEEYGSGCSGSVVCSGCVVWIAFVVFGSAVVMRPASVSEAIASIDSTGAAPDDFSSFL